MWNARLFCRAGLDASDSLVLPVLLPAASLRDTKAAVGSAQEGEQEGKGSEARGKAALLACTWMQDIAELLSAAAPTTESDSSKGNKTQGCGASSLNPEYAAAVATWKHSHRAALSDLLLAGSATSMLIWRRLLHIAYRSAYGTDRRSIREIGPDSLSCDISKLFMVLSLFVQTTTQFAPRLSAIDAHVLFLSLWMVYSMLPDDRATAGLVGGSSTKLKAVLMSSVKVFFSELGMPLDIAVTSTVAHEVCSAFLTSAQHLELLCNSNIPYLVTAHCKGLLTRKVQLKASLMTLFEASADFPIEMHSRCLILAAWMVSGKQGLYMSKSDHTAIRSIKKAFANMVNRREELMGNQSDGSGGGGGGDGATIRSTLRSEGLQVLREVRNALFIILGDRSNCSGIVPDVGTDTLSLEDMLEDLAQQMVGLHIQRSLEFNMCSVSSAVVDTESHGAGNRSYEGNRETNLWLYYFPFLFHLTCVNMHHFTCSCFIPCPRSD
jgi:hypothetical protein